MAIVRGLTPVSRAMRMVYGIGQHVPLVNRFALRGGRDYTMCPERYLEQRTRVDDLLSEYRQEELQDEVQLLEFLEELLARAGEKRHVAHLLSNHAEFHKIFRHIFERAETCNTDTIMDLLALSHKHGVNHDNFLLPLAEELATRIEDMPYHLQQKALHVLSRLKLPHVNILHESVDIVSFTKSLRQDAVNKDTVGDTVFKLKGHYWSKELCQSLRDYVLRNVSKLSLRSVYQILSVMVDKHIATPNILTACAKAVAAILSRDVPVMDRCEVWGERYSFSLLNLAWIFGKVKFHDEELYHAFASLVENPNDPCILTPRFISSFAWSCGKVRFYSESLMDSIASYSLRRLSLYKLADINLLLYGFGALNCHHLDLFNSCVERIVCHPDHLKNHKFCWVIAWVGLVMDQYPERLLSGMLTDDYLKYSTDDMFRYSGLLQLSVALNFEHPELGFGIEFDPTFASHWGMGAIRVGDVSDDMMKHALERRISRYRLTSRHSPFSQNVGRALKVALGSTYLYNTEALSLSGYNLDFEILFDDEHRPIIIPYQWKYRDQDILKRSIGVRRILSKQKPTAELLHSMKETERNAHPSSSSSSTVQAFTMDHRTVLAQLASDWGQKFNTPNAPVAKRVAIEVDGPFHFASNCNHLTGSTALKHRLLKALGWEVVSIPYMEWEHLANGDDHVQYLINRLNLHNLKR